MENFSGETPYAIMFGPDICGHSTKRVHVILPYKDDNHLIDRTVPCETDVFTHVYTLAIHPDNSYEVCFLLFLSSFSLPRSPRVNNLATCFCNVARCCPYV